MSIASANKPMSEKVQKPPVLVDRADADWFDAHYPSHGSWTWFVRTALKKFRDLHGKDSPDSLIELGMRELLRGGPPPEEQ